MNDIVVLKPGQQLVPVAVPSFEQRAHDVDWSFDDHRADSLSSVHPYPAKFISAIPAKLLEMFPPEHGTTVLDPFCGSGTTLLEAQRRGHHAVGVDLNPIATMISRVKTSPRPTSLLEKAEDAVGRARRILDPAVPNIPNLDHWFKPEIQVAVASLSCSIGDADGTVQDCLRLALSSILVRVSNQDSDTRYAAVEKSVRGPDVFDLFTRAVRRVDAALAERGENGPACKVVEDDVLAVSPDAIGARVGAVITSPPYPNAYEYWLYHKYRMWWLGFDPIAVREREIGARAHFFGKNKHDETNFVEQMAGTLKLIRDVLVPGGHVSFVVGRSKIHGKLVDNAEIIKTEGERLGFECVFREERLMSKTKKSFNLSHANIKTETILVLRG